MLHPNRRGHLRNEKQSAPAFAHRVRWQTRRKDESRSAIGNPQRDLPAVAFENDSNGTGRVPHCVGDQLGEDDFRRVGIEGPPRVVFQPREKDAAAAKNAGRVVRLESPQDAQLAHRDDNFPPMVIGQNPAGVPYHGRHVVATRATCV